MTTYDLVFEGGGAKGLAFAGAIEAFEDAGHQPGRLMGTSAGAITAALLAAGYTIDEIRPALTETLPNGKLVFSSFLGEPTEFSQDVIRNSLFARLLRNVDVPLVPETVEQRVDDYLIRAMLRSKLYRYAFSFEEQGGVYSADPLVVWLTEKLNANGRNYGSVTLQEFHEATDRELTTIAADTTGGQMLILNHNTAPDVPVVMAVRMSMSVPFLWQEVIWQPEWGTYRGEDVSGHAVVDGGAVSNFPIELFLSESDSVTEIMGEPSGNVLGFLLDESKEVPDAPPHTALDEEGVAIGDWGTVQRVAGLADTMMGAHDRRAIQTYKDRIVRLPAKSYGTIEFDMTPERLEALIAAGKATTVSFLGDLGFESMPAIDQDTIDDVAESILE